MSQSKEELLLHAALRLFNEYGFHGTATAKISKEAGVSTGTLYNYFESKEVLIYKLYVYIKTELCQYTIDRMTEGKTTVDSIESLWSSMVWWAIEHPDYYKFKEAFYRSPYIEVMNKDDIVEANKPLLEIAYKTMGRLMSASEHNPLLTEYFTGALNATINYIHNNKVEDIDLAIKNGFDLLWSGISRKM